MVSRAKAGSGAGPVGSKCGNRDRRPEPGWGLRGVTLLLASLPMLSLMGPGARAQGVKAPDRDREQPRRALREICDAPNGARWLLLRDPEHPGGPGRLALAAPVGSDRVVLPANQAVNQATNQAADREPILPPAQPVIRGGDRLVVEESSPVVEGRFEAVALGPAAVGSVFEARLKVGGKPVQVVALGPGRAALGSPASQGYGDSRAAQGEVQP